MHSPRELEAHIHEDLPHGSFKLTAQVLGATAVQFIVCRCDRSLPWIGNLPSGILIRWLANHDDDSFLTAEQFAAKHSATIDPLPITDLFSDPDLTPRGPTPVHRLLLGPKSGEH